MQDIADGFRVGDRFIPWGTLLGEAAHALGCDLTEPGQINAVVPCDLAYGLPALAAGLRAPAAQRPVLSVAYALAELGGLAAEDWLGAVADLIGPAEAVDRHEIAGGILSSSNCHCRTCRRTSGVQSVAWIVVAMPNFRLVGAPPVEFASSSGVIRTFCGRCGTCLTFQDSEESIDVTLASLDDPELVPPTRESWLAHRLSWVPIDDRLAQNEGPAE